MLNRFQGFTFFLLLLGSSLVCPSAFASRPARLPVHAPSTVGMNARQLAYIDAVVAEGIRDGQMPGCVVAVGRRGRIVFLEAYGDRQVKPTRVRMTTDTVFDLASLTKPIATATSVMQLVERGQLRLRDTVTSHIQAFGQNGKQRITVFQLLTHESGLIADNSMRDYQAGPESAMNHIYKLSLPVEPGQKFVYSDVGFIVLADLVQAVSGKNIDRFANDHIFAPLGMRDTGYVPNEALRQRAAPCDQRDGVWIRGEVHDPRSHALGGIAGHAGLFSTAADLAVFAQMMLNEGSYDGVRILGPATVRQMTREYQVSRGLRGLGWDKQSGYSSNRGELFSSAAFGHGGFTGTSLWIDPELEMFVIFLSNRLHPDGKGSVNSLAGRIGTIAAAAIENDPVGVATDED